MTNFEFIKNNLTELDLAYYELPGWNKPKDRPNLFSDKIYGAFDKWAESTSSNKGNMVKDGYQNPSIWAWENWHYPDGVWRKSGRNRIVAFSVWLSMQYNPEEWVDDDE